MSVADRTLQSVKRNLTARRSVLRQTHVAVCGYSKTNARRRMWLSLSLLDDDAVQKTPILLDADGTLPCSHRFE
jgi:hypothetical protein